jgi:hypothetical protein
MDFITRLVCIAAIAGSPSATAARADAITTCAADTCVPSAVAQALDNILAGSIDPAGRFNPGLGAAPGAVLSVQAPGWHYARAAGRSDPATGAAITGRF